jgi:hypothetical protein
LGAPGLDSETWESTNAKGFLLPVSDTAKTIRALPVEGSALFFVERAQKFIRTYVAPAVV